MTFKFKNSKGEEVTLNQKEKALASALDEQYGKLMNAAGMVVDITTLTTALKSVSHQKFFEVAPGDYMPINVGEGAFAMELPTLKRAISNLVWTAPKWRRLTRAFPL